MLKIDSIDLYKSDKILTFNKAINLVSKLKSQGKTVGLCHGGFDLLHPGHIKHFESAKKLCDVLIVSITSDKYVSSRKGSGRPIFNDRLRAYMIANIWCVDYAVITDFESGIDVIKSLKPSYYIKGPDFINKTTPGIIAEKKAIHEINGEIKYTNDSKLSTTEIINYIKNKLDVKNILLILDRDGTLIKNDDFFGKNPQWKEEMVLNDNVMSFISYMQTKYQTTKIVITNQAGVAKRYFSCKIVEQINNHLNSELLKKGIKIDNWQYCPNVDSEYASKHPEFNLDSQYIQDETKRKPHPDMVIDGLRQLNKNIDEFDKIIIIGNRDEDKKLADNLNARFIDVNNKTYDELIKEIRDI